MKTIAYSILGAIYQTGTTDEITPGTVIKLFLDQTFNPLFPESIQAVLQNPVGRTRCGTTTYIFQYDEDDLDGSGVTSIRPCDIINITSQTCCEVLGEQLEAEVQARTDADTALGVRIDDEESARVAADQALQEDVDGKAPLVHTHVSADITDATSDAVTVPDKLLKADSIGSITLQSLVVKDYIIVGLNSGNITVIQPTPPTADREIFWPDAGGTAAVVPPFADSTAADLVVSVGDAWYDTTLKKVRVRLV